MTRGSDSMPRGVMLASVGPTINYAARAAQAEWVYVFNWTTHRGYIVHVTPPSFICQVREVPEWRYVRTCAGAPWPISVSILISCLLWYARPSRTFRRWQVVWALKDFTWLETHPRGRALDTLLDRAERAYLDTALVLPEIPWDGDRQSLDDYSLRVRELVKLLTAQQFVLLVSGVSSDGTRYAMDVEVDSTHCAKFLKHLIQLLRPDHAVRAC
jgi:hypothetical protein